MAITRGDFLRSLGKSLPGLVASTGVATAAEALIRRIAQAAPEPESAPQPVTYTPFFEHGPTEGNEIALTFDDGPEPGVTERILDELKHRKLQATFFMIGQKVAAAPDLARRVLAEGHEVGNHTFSHRKLAELPDAVVAAELERTQRIFADSLGRQAAWLRPPFGSFRRNQAPLATARGLNVALWSVDSHDWRVTNPSQLGEDIWTKAEAGSIILCHELSSTAATLGRIFDELLSRQFRFVTVSSLYESDLRAKQRSS